jgi:heme oxygenase
MFIITTVTTASSLFSEALRAMTWGDHEKAEYTGYTQALLHGQISSAGYAELVAQHYFAYVELEAAAERMRDDALAGRFVFDSLRRVPALEADLQYLLGADWRERISPSRATGEYCERLREVCFTWPGGYIAHSYTRYLGDLSGGQIIKRAMQKAFPAELGDGQGVAFYDFPEIADYQAFKAEYRLLLDGAGWDAEERQRVIDEAVLAYRLNTLVLAELGRDLAQHTV